MVYDQRMKRIASTLASAGYIIKLVGRTLKQSIPLENTTYQQVRIKCLFEKGPLFYAEYQLRICLIVLLSKHRIVNAVDLDTLPGVWLGVTLSKLFLSRVLVFDAHEIFSEQEEVVARPKVQAVWQWLERKLIRLTDERYTVSQGVVNWYKSTMGQPFKLIRNLPLIQHYHAQTHQLSPHLLGKKYLLYVGAVNQNRGLEEVMDAMAHHTLDLVICGNGPGLESLIAKAIQLDLDNRVFFEGYVKPIDLPPYYHHAYLGLLMLKGKGLNYQYSLANKFFDYVMFGLPQLVSPLPEYIELISQYEVGLLIQPESEKIAEAIVTLDPSKYLKMKEQTVLAANVWNWESESQKLISIYDGL